MKNNKLDNTFSSYERSRMLLRMMYFMLLDYHRQPKIGEVLKKLHGHKMVAASRMVTKKRMPILARELLPWLRMELNLHKKAFKPSEDHRPLIERFMKRGIEHCMCLVVLAAEHGK